MVGEPASWEDERLSEAIRRLVAALQPTRVYLFGSRSRDQATHESDYDLMVLVGGSDEPPHRRAQQAYGALWGVGVPIDVLVWTEIEFDQQVPVVASLPATIIREGQLL